MSHGLIGGDAQPGGDNVPGIAKRVGFHTFRHTYTTLLTQNNEDIRSCRSFSVMQTAGSTGSVCAGRNGGKAGGAAQSRGNGIREGEGSSLIGPYWTLKRIADSSQLLERNGGDDGTRTRDLCRDRAAF